MPSSPVATEEQVAEGLAPKQGQPPTPPMLLAIVLEMAPLAERHEVARPVVGGVMVPVSSREHHTGGPHLHWEVLDLQRTPDLPTCPVAPCRALRIPPASIAEVTDHPPMRPPAFLTLALRTLEADEGGELRPVDGVEPAVLGADRHPTRCQTASARAGRMLSQVHGPEHGLCAPRTSCRHVFGLARAASGGRSIGSAPWRRS